MATSVVENLDFTNIDRLTCSVDQYRPNDPNDNINPIDSNGEMQNKSNSEMENIHDNSNPKRAGRFQQVVHAYLAFEGRHYQDISKYVPTLEEKRDFVVRRSYILIEHNIRVTHCKLCYLIPVLYHFIDRYYKFSS